MAKLNSLFDFQKIAKSNKLQNVIDEVDSKYSVNGLLSDDELENVSAGAGVQFMRIACPECGTINNVNVSASSFTCGSCKKLIRIQG